MSDRVHVVLSGGSGSRLWPLSRKSRTKQFIPIFEGKSLFQLTLDNNSDLCDKGVVVGNLDNYQSSRSILSEIKNSEYEIIVEALPKNTAAAIAFAALSAKSDDLLLVTPSDHVIEDLAAYSRAVEEAFALAKEGYLVTFGIEPVKPETGYGYIQVNGSDVVAFHEKPSADTAKKYIEDGDYFWNSGIFAFKASVFLEELQRFRPDIFKACKRVMENKSGCFLDQELSKEIPSESIDYAVMENSKRLKIVKGTFKWSDLGSFESLFEYFSSRGEFVQGSNLVITDNLHVELHGLEDVMVIQEGERLLVMPLRESQKVKSIYENLQQSNPDLIS